MKSLLCGRQPSLPCAVQGQEAAGRDGKTGRAAAAGTHWGMRALGMRRMLLWLC